MAAEDLTEMALALEAHDPGDFQNGQAPLNEHGFCTLHP